MPITKYATQLVANLAKEPGYPADFVATYAANIVSKEDNVKAVVAKIELGEGDAGIVYVTDAKASDKVTTIDVPDRPTCRRPTPASSSRPRRTPRPRPGVPDWFAGPDGQAILASFGFLPPRRDRRRRGARRAATSAAGRRPADAPRSGAGASARSRPSRACSPCSSGCPS